MSYVVNWEQTDGTAGWHSVAEIGDAVAHVESLRNGQGIESARIYRLDEVAFHLKPYFRVELADTLRSAPVAAAPVPAPVAPAPVPVAPAAPMVVAEEAAPEAARPVHGDGSWVEAAWPEPEAAAESALEPAAETGANGTHRRGLFGR